MSARVLPLPVEPPDGATFREVAEAARAHGLHLIHNGRRIVVSPVIPPGWREVAITIKAPRTPPEVPCAA